MAGPRRARPGILDVVSAKADRYGVEPRQIVGSVLIAVQADGSYAADSAMFTSCAPHGTTVTYRGGCCVVDGEVMRLCRRTVLLDARGVDTLLVISQ